MDNLQKVLKEFGDLPSLVRFLNEKINDGQEISRGKTPTETSKQQKEAEAPKKPPGPDAAGGGEGETATAPVIDPSAAPGSQITLGNKQPDPEFRQPTTRIELSGRRDIVNTEPRANVNYSNGTY